MCVIGFQNHIIGIFQNENYIVPEKQAFVFIINRYFKI